MKKLQGCIWLMIRKGKDNLEKFFDITFFIYAPFGSQEVKATEKKSFKIFDFLLVRN